MENKIIKALESALYEIKDNQDDLTGLSDFMIQELKSIAIHLQLYGVAAFLRNEQKRRLENESK